MSMEPDRRPLILSDRLDDLVIARLATSSQPPSVAELARATRAFAPATCDETAWAALIADAVARLIGAGQLDGERRAPGGPAAAAARFGLAGALDWKRVQDRIVPGLALGLAADDTKGHARLKTRDAWVAAVVGRARGLWTAGPPPSLAAVADALVWQALALPGKPGRNPKAVRAHFVGVALGGGAAASTGTLERRAALLAAQAAGAVRADLNGLREALVRHWLQGLSWVGDPSAPPPARAPTSASPVAAAPPASDPHIDFAAEVQAAAGRVTEGRFGARKVFVAALWRDPAFAGLSLAEFKARLLAAHRAGTTTLARADLTGAMDPALLRESEIAHLDSRYHFVETEAP